MPAARDGPLGAISAAKPASTARSGECTRGTADRLGLVPRTGAGLFFGAGFFGGPDGAARPGTAVDSGPYYLSVPPPLPAGG